MSKIKVQETVVVNGLTYVLANNQEQDLVSQEEAAAILGVQPVRMCELHRFNYLKPVGKSGRNLVYNRKDVEKAATISRVKHWVNSFKG